MFIKKIKLFREERREKKEAERKQKVEEIIRELNTQTHVITSARFSMLSDILQLADLDPKEARVWIDKYNTWYGPRNK